MVKPTAAAVAPTAFAVDQVVLVQTWRGEEQPGTIVSVRREDASSEEEDQTTEYVVRLLIAEETVTCDASQLKEYVASDDAAEPTTSRRSRRANPSPAVTPSPPKKKRGSKKAPTETMPIDESPVKTPTKRKHSAADRVSALVAATAESSPHFEPQAKSAATRKPKKKALSTTTKTKPKASIATVERSTTAPNEVPFCQPISNDTAQQDGRSNMALSDSDSDDDDDAKDRPFTVSYAPTGRARCARCDSLILKGELRITHKPLFRGKQGFQVSRHLPCAVFTEDIDKAEDVGGWKSLSSEDFGALTMRVEESKLELEEEQNELQPDELVKTIFHGETREPPQGLVASLLPFQVEGVSWMYHQETQVPEIRGGILADEMGMGKTLQTITTIVDNRPLLQHSKPGVKHPPSATDIEQRRREESLWGEARKNWQNEMNMIGVPDSLLRPNKGSAGCRAGTLVVCPLIALSQWKSEIEKFTAPGTLSIGVYHGTSRATDMPAKMLQKYDIVLTTYQVLEQDFRKMVSPNKIACPNCGGKYKIDKLRVHLKYFCGEGAERTEAQARQRRNGDRGRPTGGGGKTGKGLKKTMTKTKQLSPTKTSKTLKVKSTESYESESDLSVDSSTEKQGTSQKRPSRSAAASASKKLAHSVKEWAAKSKRRKSHSDDDESAYSEASEVDDDEDDDDDDASVEEVVPAKRRRIAKDDDAPKALARAKQRQAEALAATKKKKKSMPKQKKKAKSKSRKKPNNKKEKGKDKDSDDDSSSDSSEDEDRDPLEGIDLDALTKQAMEGSQLSLLHSVCWWRVVLDEAHFIKSRSSQTSHAAFSLTAIHRWCLSGTPLQNRVGELYSLIRFLRISPMAHYFCRMKDCDCQSIHYRMKQGVCQDCSHRQFSHYSHFNKHVLTPIQRDGYTGDGRRAMFKLKNEVLDKCLLRRTKETKAEDMNLPPRIVRIKYVRLHPIEEDFYQGLYTQTKASFNDYVEEGTLLNNYAHIFDLLTKMRQAVDHPYLLVHSKTNHMKLGKRSQVANGSVDCMMCHEAPTEHVVSSCCGAGFCRSCVIEYIAGGGGESTPCPSCEEPFTIDLNQKSIETGPPSAPSTTSEKDPVLKDLPHVATGSILRRINLAEFATSTKIEVLIQSLVEMRKERPGGKALVFSQFVNMLDLVRWRLHSDPFLSDLGLGVRILHGGMDAKSRDAALKSFREDSQCRVLLMSLKAAGVALNLTVASECYLLDLWWNPAAEMQAIDRCHRLGQHRPIRAVRFVAEGTVEERVLQLQEKKRLVFDGTVGRDAGSLKMLTVNDMKSLFS